MATTSFDDYVASLAQLTAIVDPTLDTPESQEIRDAGDAIDAMQSIDATTLVDLIRENPNWVRALGLAVGACPMRSSRTPCGNTWALLAGSRWLGTSLPS